MPASIRTEPRTDHDGMPAKRLIIANDEGIVLTVDLGNTESKQLSAALKPEGRDITILNP